MATPIDNFYTSNAIVFADVLESFSEFVPKSLFKQPYNIVKKYKIVGVGDDVVSYSRIKIPRICCNVLGAICSKTNDVDIDNITELSESIEDLPTYEYYNYAIHGDYFIIQNPPDDSIIVFNYIGLLDSEVIIDKTMEDNIKQLNYYLLKTATTEAYKQLDNMSNDYKNIQSKNLDVLPVRKSNGFKVVKLYAI